MKNPFLKVAKKKIEKTNVEKKSSKPPTKNKEEEKLEDIKVESKEINPIDEIFAKKLSVSIESLLL
jgi:hypothetical protein